MTDITSTVQIVLEEAGYVVWLASVDQITAVCFEDEAVMGFACVFGEPRDLLERWRSTETALLHRHAARFRAAEEKAWNVYAIFLCGKDGTEEETREIRGIDEDLERTRKIASCGLAGKEEVITALLPVLPIQYRPVLEGEDLTERLKKRITAIAPAAAEVALNEDVPAREVAALLGEKS